MEFKALNKIIKIILGIFVLFFIVALLSGGDSPSDDNKTNSVQEPAKDSQATPEQKNVTTSSSDETVKETTSSEVPEKEIVSTSFSDFALIYRKCKTFFQIIDLRCHYYNER